MQTMTLPQIRAALADRNLAFMARQLGCTRSWLSAIRTGAEVPSEQFCAKLSQYLANPFEGTPASTDAAAEDRHHQQDAAKDAQGGRRG